MSWQKPAGRRGRQTDLISVLKEAESVISPYSFIATYKVEHTVCDRIADFFKDNKHLAQAGRLGENPRVDKSMKDSLDLSIPIRIYGQVDSFF